MKKKIIIIVSTIIFVVLVVSIDIIINKKTKYEDFSDSLVKTTNNKVIVSYKIKTCQERIVKKYTKIENRVLKIYYDIEKISGICEEDTKTDEFVAESNKYNKVKVYYRVVKTDDSYEMVKKPIIYLYPEKYQNINIKLNKNDLLVSYPKYNDEWNVFADENATITYNNKKYYALYYEAKNNVDFKVLDEGFVVKGKDTDLFLEEKLEILGLNYKEKEEFIVYWLPILEKNKYNYIRFASYEEINKNTPIEITPTPDTIIRILMTYKKLDKQIKVKEQHLSRVERHGYSVVEWGGTEIK